MSATDPVAVIADAVRSKKVTALEVTEAYLARIAEHDGKLGCYYRVDQDGARALARNIDEKIARGEDPGLLAGVPIGVKDLLVTSGVETTAGSKILAGWIPPYDGTVVAKLKVAGAVLLGKLSMDEFAMGSSNETSAFGNVKNPWDVARVPGGSSGGSAASVAAGLCAASIGTDTGGSIRQPASLTGTIGIKPTYGRVSRYGVIAFASSLDQVGPFARSASDAALVLRAISGHDPHDSTSLPQSVPDWSSESSDPRGLRIGVPAEYFDHLDASIAAPVNAALKTLEAAGATLVPVKLPHTRYGVAAYYIVATAECSSNLARYDGIRYGLRVPADSLAAMYKKTRAAGFGPEVKRRIMLGTYALRSGYYDAYYRKAQQVRTLVKRDFDEAFRHCDVIAGPTSPQVAFKLGEKTADPLSMYLSDIYTIPCNLAGLPGMSIPCGFARPKDGGPELPVGLQLLAAPLAEGQIFRAARALQQRTDFHTRRPPEFA
ncbi:MAG: Asp-tRNA(Asn)/Glu-tRNA(Gln) amidotransferase subunit GatA [Polyangia bacterium]